MRRFENEVPVWDGSHTNRAVERGVDLGTNVEEIKNKRAELRTVSTTQSAGAATLTVDELAALSKIPVAHACKGLKDGAIPSFQAALDNFKKTLEEKQAVAADPPVADDPRTFGWWFQEYLEKHCVGAGREKTTIRQSADTNAAVDTLSGISKTLHS